LDTVKDDVKALGENVDKAIETAQKALDAKTEEEKMNVAKEHFQNALDALNNQVKTHQARMDKLSQTLKEMEEKLAEVEEVIKTIETRIADVEQLLAESSSARTRGEDRDKLLELMNKLKENMGTVTAQRDELKDQIALVQAQLATVDESFQTEKTLAESAPALLQSLTTSEEVEAQAGAMESQASLLGQLLVENINKISGNCNNVIDNLNILIDNVNNCNKNSEVILQETKAITGLSTLQTDEAEVQGRYDMQGRQVDSNQKGLQIIRMKNGQTRKVYVR
jgi:chromosome segregation ATPase